MVQAVPPVHSKPGASEVATKRRKRVRGFTERITPEAVAAYQAGDWGALTRALRLKPWDMTARAVIHGHCVVDTPEQIARTNALRAELDALAGGADGD